MHLHLLHNWQARDQLRNENLSVFNGLLRSSLNQLVMEKDLVKEVSEEEGSRRIEIKNSIFAGSMLISRGRVVRQPRSRLVYARMAAPFCCFNQEPPIYVEQPDDDRDMSASTHAPAT